MPERKLPLARNLLVGSKSIERAETHWAYVFKQGAARIHAVAQLRAHDVGWGACSLSGLALDAAVAADVVSDTELMVWLGIETRARQSICDPLLAFAVGESRPQWPASLPACQERTFIHRKRRRNPRRRRWWTAWAPVKFLGLTLVMLAHGPVGGASCFLGWSRPAARRIARACGPLTPRKEDGSVGGPTSASPRASLSRQLLVKLWYTAEQFGSI